MALSRVTEGSMPLTLCMLIGAIIAMLPILTIYIKWNYAINKQTNEKIELYKKIFYVFVIVLVGILANIIISHSILIETSRDFEHTKDAFSTGTKLIQLFAMGITIPILEEIVFRGIVAGQLYVVYGQVPAILFSAFFFGCVHSNLPQILFATVVGLVLGLSYLKTKSLWVPIAGHIIVNCATLLFG